MAQSASAEVMEALFAGLAIEGGLSTTEIAKRAGLSKMSVYRIDDHQMGDALLSTYIKLARCYSETLGRSPPPLNLNRR